MNYRATITTAMSVFAIATTPAHAALSGFYNSAEQIMTIFSSASVADALRQAPVGIITNSGKRSDGADEWTLTTQECDVKVYLKSIQPMGPGKVSYEIVDISHCE